jgi:hypothetical protein
LSGDSLCQFDTFDGPPIALSAEIGNHPLMIGRPKSAGAAGLSMWRTPRWASALVVLSAAVVAVGFRSDADDITIRAYPTITRLDQLIIVSGELLPAKANEYVAVQGKECGVPGAFYRSLWGASTNEGGGWEAEFFVRTKTVLRAVSGSEVSRDLTVQVRAPVYLIPMHGKPVGRFRVAAWGGGVSLGGKRVTIERFDRASSKWRAVRTVVLDATGNYRGFRIAVPKRTTVRAVLPLSQTKPCYLAGYSKLVRT